MWTVNWRCTYSSQLLLEFILTCACWRQASGRESRKCPRSFLRRAVSVFWVFFSDESIMFFLNPDLTWFCWLWGVQYTINGLSKIAIAVPLNFSQQDFEKTIMLAEHCEDLCNGDTIEYRAGVDTGVVLHCTCSPYIVLPHYRSWLFWSKVFDGQVQTDFMFFHSRFFATFR